MRKYARMVFFGLPHILRRYPKVQAYARHPERYPLKERFAYLQFFLGLVNKSSFHVAFLVEGKEKIPEGQCLFVGNHASLYDPISMVQVLDRPAGFLCKKEVQDMPLVRGVAKALDSTFIDREDLRSELLAFKELEGKLSRDKDLSYVIFPEGTRSKGPDFDVASFHPGSFKVATRRQMPIVPFVLYLSDRILNQRYHYKVYPLQVRFLDPILPEEYKDMDTKQIADLARERIVENRKALMERDKNLVMTLNRYSEKKAQKVLHR